MTTQTVPPVEAEAPVREGRYGERVAAVEPGGVELVPADERHGRPRQLLWTWTSPNLEFATVYVGVLGVALFGGGFWAMSVAIVVGTALGAVTHGVLSTMGPRFGVPQMVQSRGAFGWLGNLLPAGLNALTSGAGWVAVNSVSGAFALQTLATLAGLGQPSFWLMLLLVVLVESLVAVSGYNMVHALERLLVPYLAVVFGLCCIEIFRASQPGAAPPAGAGPGGTGAFILTLFTAYAYAVSWNPYASDYSRYLPRNVSWRAVAANAAVGLFLSCAVLEVAGAALATVAGTSWGPNDIPTDQFVKPLPHWLAIASTIGIALGAVAANVLNLYSGAMSFLTLGIRMPLRWRRAVVALGFGVLGFVVGLTGNAAPGGKYESFLFFNTYWIVPFITVVLCDYATRRAGYAVSEFFDHRRRGAAGVVAMLVGIAAEVPFMNQSLFVGWVPARYPATGDLSFVVGPVVAAAVYLALVRRWGASHAGAAAG